MDKYIFNETNGLWYELIGDYYFPCLTVPAEEEQPVGVWGQRHKRYLKEHQRDFMPEDTKAGMIQAYLDKYTGSMVCSKQLYKEALNHAFDEPKQWEIREINEIMNQCIDRWRYFQNPRMFSEYGRQKGWERENPATDLCNPSEKIMDGFVEVTEQMELPF